ncbi:MAG: Thiol-disulfide oxidoreductase ResA [Verrucomicrobiae bacterium]|nr:Thiol-disulfide oxidoreductase ResA [Verrucomicrobiae bacterium]
MNGRNFALIALAGLLIGCGKPVVTPATSTDVLNAVRAGGAKVVLVNFWASWCGPCREEFPDLVRLQNNYAERGLRVVYVSWDDTAEEAAKFLAREGVKSPSFLKASQQSDQDFMNAFEPKLSGALPTTLIYDGTGKLHSFWEGIATYAEFEKKIKTVIGGPS